MTTSAINKALRALMPKETLAQLALANKSGNLYEVLSRQPRDGVGSIVHQPRWTGKNIVGSYWLVTRIVLKGKGDHGKAWGKLVWKGALCALACVC
jgi:small subunit ribosomal protein S34